MASYLHIEIILSRGQLSFIGKNIHTLSLSTGKLLSGKIHCSQMHTIITDHCRKIVDLKSFSTTETKRSQLQQLSFDGNFPLF